MFGPGYGEGILIHLGNGDWVVVDSCLDRELKKPAILEYLKLIGVDPSPSIKLVIVTHWHDDHIRGISDIFNESKNAKFVCSAALRRTDFLELVSLSESLMAKSSGLEEFAKILAVLKSRSDGSRKESIGPEFALSGSILWRGTKELPGEILALSPSSGSLTLSYNEISRLLPLAKSAKRRIVAQSPNHVAMALWVRVGKHSILLGSDLEETGDTNTGWSVIVNSDIRPQENAGVFKVPHHGSETSHQPRVWEEMTTDGSFAILTPFVSGKINLPNQTDANRICDLTENAYITSSTRTKTSKFGAGIVEKTMKEAVRNIREIRGSTGQIRLRMKNPTSGESKWTIELFGSACHLKNLYAA